MLKKIFVLGGVLLVGAWLWAKTDLRSYVKTAYREVKGAAKKQVPVEFEIRRAEEQLNSLEEVNHRLISAQAALETEVKRLEQDNSKAEAKLAEDKQRIRTLNEALKTGATVLASYGRGPLTREELTRELDHLFRNFKIAETTLANKKELLAEQVQKLEAVRTQRDELKKAKLELQGRIEALKTQHEMLRVAEMRSQVTIDDTQLPELASARQQIEQLERRINVSMRELEIRQSERPVATPSRRAINPDLSREIDGHFGVEAAPGSVTSNR